MSLQMKLLYILKEVFTTFDTRNKLTPVREQPNKIEELFKDPGGRVTFNDLSDI